MTVLNHKEIEKKDSEIVSLRQSQETMKTEMGRLKGQVDVVNKRIVAADDAQKKLQKSIDALDKLKNTYPKQMKEIKDANEETKKLLDSALPSNVRSLLNEAAGGSKN